MPPITADEIELVCWTGIECQIARINEIRANNEIELVCWTGIECAE
ncbi:MAG: hypothetical protein OXD30_01495 [Bryobacterales bacterium]|nr:hypothetical protein [Bryobacterales bacterium]